MIRCKLPVSSLERKIRECDIGRVGLEIQEQIEEFEDHTQYEISLRIRSAARMKATRLHQEIFDEIQKEKHALHAEKLRIEFLELEMDRNDRKQWHLYAREIREAQELAEEKLETDKRIAVAMALHKRLGMDSWMLRIPEQLIEHIIQVTKLPTPPGCGNLSENKLFLLARHRQQIVNYYLDEQKAEEYKTLAQK